MLRRTIKRLKALRDAGEPDLATPAGRRAAWRHFHLVDHAWLRLWWTNLGEVAPGVWRSNQPDPRRVARYKAMGIRSIISLRGHRRASFTLFEEEACRDHEIDFRIAHLGARTLMPRENMLEVLDLFEAVEKPFLIHCKSGADRAGLASALYLLAHEGASAERAKDELSFRYLHLKNSKTGVLGHMLDHYAADHARDGIGIRDWLETRYEPEKIQASWDARRDRRAPA